MGYRRSHPKFETLILLLFHKPPFLFRKGGLGILGWIFFGNFRKEKTWLLLFFLLLVLVEIPSIQNTNIFGFLGVAFGQEEQFKFWEILGWNFVQFFCLPRGTVEVFWVYCRCRGSRCRSPLFAAPFHPTSVLQRKVTTPSTSSFVVTFQ